MRYHSLGIIVWCGGLNLEYSAVLSKCRMATYIIVWVLDVVGYTELEGVGRDLWMNEEIGTKERIEGIGEVLKEKVRGSIHVNTTIVYCTTAPPLGL